jgi:hypothetical protein
MGFLFDRLVELPPLLLLKNQDGIILLFWLSLLLHCTTITGAGEERAA